MSTAGLEEKLSRGHCVPGKHFSSINCYWWSCCLCQWYFCICKWGRLPCYYMAIRGKLHSCCLLSVSLINPVIRQLMELVCEKFTILLREENLNDCVPVYGSAQNSNFKNLRCFLQPSYNSAWNCAVFDSALKAYFNAIMLRFCEL